MLGFLTTPEARLVLAPLLSFGLTAITIPLVKQVAIHFRVTAVAATSVLEDSTERRAVPLLGGTAIVAAMLAALAAAGHLPAWLLMGALAMLAVGLIDDIVVLKPQQKLLAQVIIAGAVVLLYRPVVLSPWPIADSLVILLWLLATTNAYNLVDGLDGLAAGIGIAAGLAVAATALLFQGPVSTLALCSLALCGALAGFLIYNYHPASIFMGDSGALPIGLVLGVLVLSGGGLALNSRLTRYVFPILVLMVPLLDTLTVSVTRIATGRPISRRGFDHSHHRLLHLGLSNRLAVALCWTVAALGGFTAVGMSILPHAYLVALLPLVVLVCAIVALFEMDLTFDSIPPGIAYGYLQGAARFILSLSYRRRIVEAVLDVALIAAAYFGAYLLRLNFELTSDQTSDLLAKLPYVLIPTYAAFAAAGIYRGIWSHADLSELVRFANGATLAGILLIATGLFTPLRLSGSIVVLFVILLFNLLAATRISFRVMRKGLHRLTLPRERVLIAGAGVAGAAAARYVFSGQNRNLKLVGFVDDDTFKAGKLVHGHRVLGSLNDLERVYRKCPFDQIMLAADRIKEERLAMVWEFADRYRVAVSRFSMQIDPVETLADRQPLTKRAAGTVAAGPAHRFGS